MQREAVAVDLHRHRIDQERHVVVDDLDDRVRRLPAVLLDRRVEHAHARPARARACARNSSATAPRRTGRRAAARRGRRGRPGRSSRARTLRAASRCSGATLARTSAASSSRRSARRSCETRWWPFMRSSLRDGLHASGNPRRLLWRYYVAIPLQMLTTTPHDPGRRQRWPHWSTPSRASCASGWCRTKRWSRRPTRFPPTSSPR